MMAKIYKFEGYIVAPNGEDIDIEHLIDRYSDGFPFIRTNEYEEFEWDDDLEVNCSNDYWVADKLFCQLAYDRAVKELRNSKKTWEKIEGCSALDGNPAFRCPKCGKGAHIYRVVSTEPQERCRDCGTELVYPWEVE